MKTNSDLKSITELVYLPIYNNLNLKYGHCGPFFFVFFFLFRWGFNQLGLEDEEEEKPQHNLDVNMNDTHSPPPPAHPIQAVHVSLHLVTPAKFFLVTVVRLTTPHRYI